jgi:hypothetical protein
MSKWLSVLLLTAAAFGQSYTTVTATIVDPHGLSYAGGTVNARLNLTGGTVPTFANGNRLVIAGNIPQPYDVLNGISGSLDSTGAFSLRLTPNSDIRPASSQWVFTICAPDTAHTCFSSAQTIAGTTLDLGSTLSALAPAYYSLKTDAAKIGPGGITFADGSTQTTAGGGGGATVAGANTQVQFNDSAALGADSGLTYDKTAKLLASTGGFLGDLTAPTGGTDSSIELVENTDLNLSCATCLKIAVNNGLMLVSIHGGPFVPVSNPSFRTEAGTGGHYAVVASDNNQDIFLTTSSTVIDFPLIDATFFSGWKACFKNDTASSLMTYTAISPATLDGSTSGELPFGQKICVESDGTLFRVVDYSPSRSMAAYSAFGNSTNAAGRPTTIPIGIAQYCGTTTTCADTVSTLRQTVYGHATLSTGTATETGFSPAFTSTATAECFANDRTDATKTASAVLASTSSVTLTGTGSDVIGYLCYGSR